MNHLNRHQPLGLAALLALSVSPAFAASTRHTQPHIQTSPQLTVALTARTPDQMASFYEARGFSREMIEVLNDTCYLTVGIENTSREVIWLDLAQWHFSDSAGAITRLDREHWRALWNDMQIPLAHQSTFRWTLLPEQLDFRPKEREGGNIILPRHNRPMSITAHFTAGADRSGETITLRFDKVRCAEDVP